MEVSTFPRNLILINQSGIFWSSTACSLSQGPKWKKRHLHDKTLLFPSHPKEDLFRPSGLKRISSFLLLIVSLPHLFSYKSLPFCTTLLSTAQDFAPFMNSEIRLIRFSNQLSFFFKQKQLKAYHKEGYYRLKLKNTFGFMIILVVCNSHLEYIQQFTERFKM